MTASKALASMLPTDTVAYLAAVRPEAKAELWQFVPEADGAIVGPQCILLPRWRAGRVIETMHDGGAAVYVAPSEFSGARRRVLDVTDVRHLWLDLDGAPLPASWPLAPHATVRTSPDKYQVVWRIDGLPQESVLHNAIIVALAQMFGGDEGVQGVNRALRAPGFLHRKGEAHRVLLVRASYHRPWTWSEAKAAWPALAVAAQPRPRMTYQAPTRASARGSAVERLQRQADRVASVAPPHRSRTGPGRNTALARAAYIAGLIVASGEVDAASAMGILREGALASGLPVREAEDTIRRQMAAGIEASP